MTDDRALTTWEAPEAEVLPPEDDRPAIIRIDGYRLPPAGPTPAYTIERRDPIHQPNFETGVLVPVAQAVAFALAAAIFSGMLALVLVWSAKVMAVTFGFTLLGAIIWRFRLADSILYRVETFTGLDVNRDGYTGAPAAVPMNTYTVANPHDARRKAREVRQSDTSAKKRAELTEFVRRCYLAGTSESAHGVKATGPDRERYTAMRDTLFALGLAEWKNPERPRAGWRMTVPQSEALRILAEHTL